MSLVKYRWKMTYTTIVIFFVLFVTTGARAENAACWGDNSREEISCTQLTEKLMISFRGQNIETVRKAMRTTGVQREKPVWHFISNFKRGAVIGSGFLNVRFENDQATNISASIDAPGQSDPIEFVWSAYAAPPLGQEIDRTTKSFVREPYCSDFPGKTERCAGRDMEHELSLYQIQFNADKVELLRLLQASCNPGQGLNVIDPTGDCDRLKKRLQ